MRNDTGHYYGVRLGDIMERVGNGRGSSRRKTRVCGGGPYPEKSNVPITIKNTTWYLHPDYRRETWDEPIVVQDVKRPVNVRLLRTGEILDYSYDDKALTVLIPKSKRTDLTDVVAVQF